VRCTAQPAKVQEAGCGARVKLCRVGATNRLQRCRKQGAVHGLRVRGSGLLADQLHRPTTKGLTPVLGFGFPVDGGGGTLEAVICNLRRISKEGYRGQTDAGVEGIPPDAGNAIRNCDARQAGCGEHGGGAEVCGGPNGRLAVRIQAGVHHPLSRDGRGAFSEK